MLPSNHRLEGEFFPWAAWQSSKDVHSLRGSPTEESMMIIAVQQFTQQEEAASSILVLLARCPLVVSLMNKLAQQIGCEMHTHYGLFISVYNEYKIRGPTKCQVVLVCPRSNSLLYRFLKNEVQRVCCQSGRHSLKLEFLSIYPDVFILCFNCMLPFHNFKKIDIFQLHEAQRQSGKEPSEDWCMQPYFSCL